LPACLQDLFESPRVLAFDADEDEDDEPRVGYAVAVLDVAWSELG
jgi:hypothetical protein